MQRTAILLSLAFLMVVGAMVRGALAHPPQPYIYSEPQSAEAGTAVTVGGQDFPEGRVEIRWDAVDGALIGETTAPPRLKDQSAPFEEVSVTIPESSEGHHYLYAVGYDELGQRVDAYTPFEVIAPPSSAADNQPEQNDRATEEPSAAGSPPSTGSNSELSQNVEQQAQRSVSTDASTVTDVRARPTTVGTSAESSPEAIRPSRSIRDVEMLNASIAGPAHDLAGDDVADPHIAREPSDRPVAISDVAVMLVAAAILLLMSRLAPRRDHVVTQARTRIVDEPPMLEVVGREPDTGHPPNEVKHRPAA